MQMDCDYVILTNMIESHFLLIRSWTATLMMSSQVAFVGGSVSRAVQILSLFVSLFKKFSICWATGLKTGNIPSTKPDPYFHPFPLKEPPKIDYIAQLLKKFKKKQNVNIHLILYYYTDPSNCNYLISLLPFFLDTFLRLKCVNFPRLSTKRLSRLNFFSVGSSVGLFALHIQPPLEEFTLVTI